MKTIVKLILSTAILLTSVIGMASEPKLNIVAHGDVKSLIFEMDSHSLKTIIHLTDEDDNVIYSESVFDTFYVKKFNLKQLMDGIYFFETENSLSSIVHKISLKGEKVRILERREEMKPVFRIVEDKVFLNLLNLNKNKVEIKIKDSFSRVIFKESLTEQVLIEKAFNFENALEDKYTIVVKDGSNFYYKNIVVE